VKRFLAGLFLLAGCACLSGCAARNVVPIQMAQPGDEGLDCAALARELAANEASAARFIHQDKKVEQANTARNVGSVIPGVGLLLVLSTDLSNEEQIKARALVDRDERLRFLVKRKQCTQ
jgi:hypothetical protein